MGQLVGVVTIPGGTGGTMGYWESSTGVVHELYTLSHIPGNQINYFLKVKKSFGITMNCKVTKLFMTELQCAVF